MPLSTLYQPNLAPLNYVWALSSAYRRFPWIYDSADFASIEDDEAWDKIQRDAVFASAIENRRKAVASIDWDINPYSGSPSDKRAAQLHEALLRKISHFWDGRYNATEAIFRGSSWAFLRGRRQKCKLPGTKARIMWVPLGLEHMDRWRFRVARVDQVGVERENRKIRTRWECFSPSSHQWLPIKHTMYFLRHHYAQSESSLGYGRGLLNSMFFYFKAKEIVLSQGLAGVERWAQGLLTVKLDSMRAASVGKENSALVDAWIEELNKQKSEHILIHGAEDEIMPHWPSGTGSDMVMRFVEYLDGGVLRVVQASDLTTGTSDSGAGGSRAWAEEQGEQKKSYYASDRVRLSEDIDQGPAALTWRLNHDAIQDILRDEGLPPGCRGEFGLRQEEVFDPAARGPVIQVAIQLGLPLVKEDVYNQLALKMPTEGDDIIDPKDVPREVQDQLSGGQSGGPPPPEKGPEGKLKPVDEESSLSLQARLKAGEPCKPGERSDLTKCVPRDNDPKSGPSEKMLKKGIGKGLPSSVVKSTTERVNKTLEEMKGRRKEPKPTSPGMQLDPNIRSALLDLGCQLPPMDATNVVVNEAALKKGGDALHVGALITWKSVSKNGRPASNRGYSMMFMEMNAERKWQRVRSLEPHFLKARDDLSKGTADPDDVPGSEYHADMTVASIIAQTGLRPGSGGQSLKHGHFGVTTLLNEHVTITPNGEAHFKFIGKEGVENTAVISDKRTVAAIKHYKDNTEDGEHLWYDLAPSPAAALEEVGFEGKVKDLRTLRANELASQAISSHQAPPPPLKSKKQFREAVKSVLEHVSGGLNNKPAQARRSYMFPEVLQEFEAFISGDDSS